MIKEKEVKTTHLTLRVEASLLESIDAIAAHDSTLTAYDITRANVIKRALIEFVDRERAKIDAKSEKKDAQ